MTLLDTSTLTDMRAAQAEAMPETVLVKRLTNTTDSQGGYTRTWATNATTTGRISTTAGQERKLGDKIVAMGDYLVTVPYTVDVTAKDRLVIGSRTFEIVHVMDKESWETARRCVCKELL